LGFGMFFAFQDLNFVILRTLRKVNLRGEMNEKDN